MHLRRWSVCVLLSLVGCGDDKSGVTSLNPTNQSQPSGFDDGNDDDNDDDGPGKTETSAETGGTPTTTSVATVPPETSADTTNSSVSTSTTVPPDTDESNSDPTTNTNTNTNTNPMTDESNSDPTNVFEDGPVGGECDIWAENCPNGQKCMPYATNGSSWNALKCVPVNGNDQPGEPCTVEGSGVSGLDTCEKHAICWGVDNDTLEGTCVQMCTGTMNNPVCPQGTSCTISNDDVLILCLAGCDPLSDSCESDEVCIVSDESFVCIIDASGSEGQQGDACEFANACDPGFYCVNSSSISTCQQNIAGCCTEWCDINNPACAAGLTCNAVFEQGMAPAGYEHIGLCTD